MDEELYGLGSISAPPQNKFLGGMANFMKFLEKEKPEFLPKQLDAMGLIRQFALPSSQTVENLSYGNSPFTMPPSGTGAMIPQVKTGRKAEVADLIGLISGGVPGTKVLADTGQKISSDLMGSYMKMLQEANAPGGRSFGAFVPTKPSKPDPSVGTRFEREFLGGLAEKTPVKIEDLKGSSLMLMPWDSSNRNYLIKSISDEPLPFYSVTHGGHDYSRDLEHMKKKIVGASNLDIAKRIQDRAIQGRIENLEAGGTGDIIPLPTTMGFGSANFSVQPTLPTLGLIDLRKPSKAFVKYFDQEIKNFKIPKIIKDGDEKKRVITQPFKNFKGVMTEEGRIQIMTGEGLESTSGELRKALAQIASKKSKGFEGGSNQEYLRYNLEDLTNAITDDALLNVPKGYAGNTVIRIGPEGTHLTPSSNATYSTDFSGDYLGTLGQSIPAEKLFPKLFPKITQEMAGKKGDVRNMVLGALEKRKEGITEIVDQQVIDSVNEYFRQLNSGLLGP